MSLKRESRKQAGRLVWRPTIRASIQADYMHADKAVQMLEVAARYDLASPNPAVEVGSFLYPAYIVGKHFCCCIMERMPQRSFRNFLIIGTSPQTARSPHWLTATRSRLRDYR
jgi:hypothetical protein